MICVLIAVALIATLAGEFVAVHSRLSSRCLRMMTSSDNIAGNVIAFNRQANFEYEFTEKYTCGIKLTGSEVKSCRKKLVQLSDGIAEIRDGEMWLLNVHITEHDKSSHLQNHEPKRVRKLLLKKSEILKIEQRILQRNNFVVPIQVFFNDKQFIKVEIGIGTKKSLIDKRDTEQKRDGEREIRRVMKGSYD